MKVPATRIEPRKSEAKRWKAAPPSTGCSCRKALPRIGFLERLDSASFLVVAAVAP
jgi:hypothetical protein